MRRIAGGILAAAIAASCSRTAQVRAPLAGVEPMLLGEFVDDYGESHSISDADWIQQIHSRFHIVRWSASQRFLIARNDAANKNAPNKWTRIDWIRLDGMPPYTWAFCFSAYQAGTAGEAESTSVAKPETPRTGCNGHPFTRMRPIGR
jgi:hypothetical protein